MVSKGAIGTLLAMVVVAVTLLAGCGGGGEDSTLTKSQFVSQANALCKKGEEERLKIFQSEAQKLSPKEQKEQPKQEEVILAGLGAYEKAAEDISGLNAPAGEQKEVEDLVAAMEEAADRVKANPGTALVSGLPFKKADEAAEKIGLQDCVI
jgi:hypothetical protein